MFDLSLIFGNVATVSWETGKLTRTLKDAVSSTLLEARGVRFTRTALTSRPPLHSLIVVCNEIRNLLFIMLENELIITTPKCKKKIHQCVLCNCL